jgi:phage tail protein X
MEFYEYITKDGDRWDTIAYEYYGDATLYESIISANPDIPITPVLKSGLKITVLVIDIQTSTTEDLPPWKC